MPSLFPIYFLNQFLFGDKAEQCNRIGGKLDVKKVCNDSKLEEILGRNQLLEASQSHLVVGLDLSQLELVLFLHEVDGFLHPYFGAQLSVAP